MEKKYWIRPNELIYKYSIKRTSLYKLINSGKIETRLLSPRTRLISVLSLESYLDSFK